MDKLLNVNIITYVGNLLVMRSAWENIISLAQTYVFETKTHCMDVLFSYFFRLSTV